MEGFSRRMVNNWKRGEKRVREGGQKAFHVSSKRDSGIVV